MTDVRLVRGGSERFVLIGSWCDLVLGFSGLGCFRSFIHNKTKWYWGREEEGLIEGDDGGCVIMKAQEARC